MAIGRSSLKLLILQSLIFYYITVSSARSGCPVTQLGLAPLSTAEVATVEAACEASRIAYSATASKEESCPACLCAVWQAVENSLARSHSDLSQTASPDVSIVSLSQCGEEVAPLLREYLSTMSDLAWGQLTTCSTLREDKLTHSLESCDARGAAQPPQRRLLQVPAGINNTLADISGGAQNAATTTRDRWNNLTTDLNQLGQNSSLDAAARSGSANPGQYVNAFVNDTRGALSAIGNAFTGNAAGQVAVRGYVGMAAAAVVLVFALL